MTFFPIDRVMPQALRAGKKRGMHLAIVVDNKDGVDNPGYRVKVTYPWLSDQEQTFWARIAVPMGGAERGTYFLPEIDDQVLVVFEHGDINRPIVMGALWSKKQEPVEVNESGKNNTKLIKSRAGHRIIFDDKDGAEKVTIVDKTRKNRIVLDAANQVVTIESDGDLEVKAEQNIVVHANALKLGIENGLGAKGQQALAHAKSTLMVKANAKIVVSGTSVTTNVTNSPAASVGGSGAGFLGAPGTEAPKDPVEAEDRAAAGGGGGGGGGPIGPVSSTGDGAAAPPALEPQPVLVAAAWSTFRAPVSTSVVLAATCADLAGSAATFTISDADEDRVLATVSGTCGDADVRASWTTPSSGPPGRFVFTVAAGGKEAGSGLLTLINLVEATLVLDDEPADGVRVRLRAEPSGEELVAQAGADGVVRFEDAPFGDYTLHLDDAP